MLINSSDVEKRFFQRFSGSILIISHYKGNSVACKEKAHICTLDVNIYLKAFLHKRYIVNAE